jgi:hypothetical protein
MLVCFLENIYASNSIEEQMMEYKREDINVQEENVNEPLKLLGKVGQLRNMRDSGAWGSLNFGC